MAMAVFAPLAVGKTGLDFLQPFFGVAGFAVVDLATAINNEPPLAAVLSTSESNIENKIAKRAVCWLAIGLLQGTSTAFFVP
jgi:predicted cobalt transporter CbtA